MEGVGTNKYRKLIETKTELGEDFRNLADCNQLQLNKKILKWRNVLADLELWSKVQMVPYTIKVPNTPRPQSWVDYDIVPALNDDGTPKLRGSFNDRQKIRDYLNEVFKTHNKVNAKLRVVMENADSSSASDFNRDLFREYMKILRENIDKAVQMYNSKIIELVEIKNAKANEYKSKEVECECGGKYSMRNKHKHFLTKKHTDWEQTQAPIVQPEVKAEVKENPQNQEVMCECGGKYTVRNKQTHFKTAKHKKFFDL